MNGAWTAIAGRAAWPRAWRLARYRRPGWALADQCVVSACNFLTIFLFARTMSTPAFGAFMIAHTGLMLLTSVQGALIVQPHNVLAAPLGGASYRRFTAALGAAQLLFTAALCAALAAAAGLLQALGAAQAGGVVLALALAAFPWLAQEFVRRVFYTHGETRAAFANDALTYGLQLAGALAAVIWLGGGADARAAFVVLGASSLAGAAAGLWQLRGHLQWNGGWLRALIAWKEAWDFGKWLLAQSLLAWMGTHGHAWVVGIMLGAEQVGLYRAATHLVNVMNPVRQAAFNYLPSRGSKVRHSDGQAGLSRWMRRTFWFLLLAPLPVALPLMLFPGPILSLAYGDRYSGPELALILALATLAQLVTFVKFTFDLGLLALRGTKSIFYVHLIPVALLFTTGIGLVYAFGIVGVPLSALLIGIAVLAATAAAYRRLAKAQEAG